jgi:hypothetical protein
MSPKANLMTCVRIWIWEGSIEKEIMSFVEVLEIILGELEPYFVA